MQSEEAAEKLRGVVMPYVGFSAALFEPLKAWFKSQDASTGVRSSLMPIEELAQQLRGKLGNEPHT